MEKGIAHYMRKHTLMMTFIVFIGFLLMAGGEYFLYRNQMKLNKMLSEGLMQLKEEKKVESMLMGDQVVLRQGQVILRKSGHTRVISEDTTLEDGMTITPKGDLIKKDGTKLKLFEGKLVSLE